jgi:hypothetical protein
MAHRATLAIRTITTSGAEAQVDVVVRRDTVEIWRGDRCAAVLDRFTFQAWLAHPVRALVVDDVMWAPVDEQVALVVSGADTVGPWTLPPDVYEELRWRV